jgi:phosphoserine aminotransferase
MELPWEKLDVVTFSWQKVLGGEAAHGVIILSERAVNRLETFVPPRPLPKLFRLTKKGKIDEAIFEGVTINTPSMLCVEDYLDALNWADSIGGLESLISRSQLNLSVIEGWVHSTGWVDFLASSSESRSSTSICIKIVSDWFVSLPNEKQVAITKEMTGLLDSEGVAHDIDGYRNAPPGLRIWGGATVERTDLEALLPWLDWAYETVSTKYL